MTIQFGYDKKQVLQALRYHFITRPEIKVLLILVNVFTIVTAVLVYLHKIQPLSFLIFSLLWFLLLITVWKVLPSTIYKKSKTFSTILVWNSLIRKSFCKLREVLMHGNGLNSAVFSKALIFFIFISIAGPFSLFRRMLSKTYLPCRK